MASELSVLQLYRHILRAARNFPSGADMRPGIGPPPDRRRPPNPQVKKSSIIKEIKAEFRANKAVAEPEQVQRCRVLAERGLSDLQAYSSAAAAPGGDASISLKGATQ